MAIEFNHRGHIVNKLDFDVLRLLSYTRDHYSLESVNRLYGLVYSNTSRLRQVHWALFYLNVC